jgi:hypothetical protein
VAASSPELRSDANLRQKAVTPMQFALNNPFRLQ